MYEAIAFVVGEKVVDYKDVRLFVDELQVGIKNIYSVKVGIGEIAIQGKVWITRICYSSVCLCLLLTVRGVDCCGRCNSTIPEIL